MIDISREAVERLAKEYDSRADLLDSITGPNANLRTERAADARASHIATATTLRALRDALDKAEREPAPNEWFSMDTAPMDGSEILLRTTAYGVCQAWFNEGEWSEDTPIAPAEYSGDAWVCCDDAFQIEVELDVFGPGKHSHSGVTGWMPIPTGPAHSEWNAAIEAAAARLRRLQAG